MVVARVHQLLDPRAFMRLMMHARGHVIEWPSRDIAVKNSVIENAHKQYLAIKEGKLNRLEINNNPTVGD